MKAQKRKSAILDLSKAAPVYDISELRSRVLVDSFEVVIKYLQQERRKLLAKRRRKK